MGNADLGQTRTAGRYHRAPPAYLQLRTNPHPAEARNQNENSVGRDGKAVACQVWFLNGPPPLTATRSGAGQVLSNRAPQNPRRIRGMLLRNVGEAEKQPLTAIPIYR